MVDPNQARSNMVQQQIRPWAVLDKHILRLLTTMPREKFVPTAYAELAFADTQIPLGHGQVMLQPALVGRILQSLQIKASETILEIGTGAGYLTALLAKSGRMVTSVELYKNLALQASNRLANLKIHNVEVLQGNALQILKGSKSFNVVVLTGSVEHLPKSLINQTKYGGRLFAIVGRKPIMQACIFTRMNEETWSKECLFETVVPPLEGIHNVAAFKF